MRVFFLFLYILPLFFSFAKYSRGTFVHFHIQVPMSTSIHMVYIYVHIYSAASATIADYRRVGECVCVYMIDYIIVFAMLSIIHVHTK